MSEDSRQLLYFLSFLPGGMAWEDGEELVAHFGNSSERLKNLGLATESNSRLYIINSICKFVSKIFSTPMVEVESLIRYYNELVSLLGAMAEQGNEGLETFVWELPNLRRTISYGLLSNNSDSLEAGLQLADYVKLVGLEGSRLLKEVRAVAQVVGNCQAEIRCLRGLGDIELENANYLEAQECFNKALPLCKNSSDLLGEATCLWNLGDIARRYFQFDVAKDKYKEALPLYRLAASLDGEANCFWSIGDLALQSKDFDDAKGHFEQALPLYREVGSLLGEATCIQSLGDIAMRFSDYEGAHTNFEEALDLFRRVGHLLGEANCVQSLGEIAFRWSDYGLARGHFSSALSIYDSVGSILGKANCIQSLGDISLKLGELKEAQSCYEEAGQSYGIVGSVLGEANCLWSLGDIELRQDNVESAVTMFHQAIPLFKQVGDLLGEANCNRSLGEIELENSSFQQAEERFDRALALYRQLEHSLGKANCEKSLGEIALSKADYDSALMSLDIALVRYQKLGHLAGEAACLRLIGDLYFEKGAEDQANHYYDEVLPIYRKLGESSEAASCIKTLGELAFRQGDYSLAFDRLGEARILYEEEEQHMGVANCICSLAEVRFAQGDLEGAKSEFQEVHVLYKQHYSSLGHANCSRAIGEILLQQNNYLEAHECISIAQDVYNQLGDMQSLAGCWSDLGQINVELHKVDDARKCYVKALEVFREVVDKVGESTCLEKLEVLEKLKISGKLDEQVLIDDPLQFSFANRAEDSSSIELKDSKAVCDFFSRRKNKNEVPGSGIPIIQVESSNRAESPDSIVPFAPVHDDELLPDFLTKEEKEELYESDETLSFEEALGMTWNLDEEASVIEQVFSEDELKKKLPAPVPSNLKLVEEADFADLPKPVMEKNDDLLDNPNLSFADLDDGWNWEESNPVESESSKTSVKSKKEPSQKSQDREKAAFTIRYKEKAKEKPKKSAPNIRYKEQMSPKCEESLTSESVYSGRDEKELESLSDTTELLRDTVLVDNDLGLSEPVKEKGESQAITSVIRVKKSVLVAPLTRMSSWKNHKPINKNADKKSPGEITIDMTPKVSSGKEFITLLEKKGTQLEQEEVLPKVRPAEEVRGQRNTLIVLALSLIAIVLIAAAFYKISYMDPKGGEVTKESKTETSDKTISIGVENPPGKDNSLDDRDLSIKMYLDSAKKSLDDEKFE